MHDLKNILADCLKLQPDDINDQTSMQTTENWDSLAHLQLISFLEEHYKINFSTDDIVQMTSYISIKGILEKKGICIN